MKRKTGIIAACVLVMLAIVAVGVFLLINKKESYRSVSVQQLNGEAEVFRATDELNAYQGMKLQRGDTVEVQKDSDLVLKLDQTKYVYAEEETCFRLKAIGKENSGKVKIVLKNGQALVDIQEKLAEGESFEIETGNAVLAVRGTKFRVKVYTDETGEYVTEVVGYEGEVFLETGTGETTGVLPGKTVYVIGAEFPVMIEQDSETEPGEEDRRSSENKPTPTVTPTPEPREELVVVEVYSDSGTFVEDAYVILEDSNGNLHEAVLEKDSLGNQKYQVAVLNGCYVIKVSAHGYFSVTKEEKVGAENHWKFIMSEKEMDLNYGELIGHSYRFIEAEAMTWEQAVQTCYDLGGYPAVISSQIENNFLNKIMQENGYLNAYFGYSDEEEEGNFRWLSGEVSDYENWAEGEPNNVQNEDYAMFYYVFPNGEWNDGNFGYGTQNDTKVIICEWDSNDVMSNVMPKPTSIPTPTPTMAPYDGVTDDGYKYTIENGYARVYGLAEGIDRYSVTELVIPNQIDGYPVTVIGNGAFSYCTSLTKVVLPEELTTIETEAFKHCYVLDGVTLPDTLKTIGVNAFWECHGLTEMVIPSGVTEIKEGAFSCCKSLNRVELSEGLLIIEGYAFSGCGSLTSISIPDSVTEIGYNAFAGDNALEEVKLSCGITAISGGLFKECASLKWVQIPDGVTVIGDRAFFECSALEEINFPKEVTIIEYKAFAACSSLETVVFSEGLKMIGDYAFSGCEALERVELPVGTEELGRDAFSYCSSLTAIELPEGMKKVQDYVFSNCKALVSVALPASLTEIGAYPFVACTFTAITAPSGSFAERWAEENGYEVQH